MRPQTKTLAGVLMLGALIAVVATGCGGGGKKASSTTTATTTSTGVDSKIAAEVPAKIKSKGTLTVATDPTYPPNESVGSDGKTIVG